MDLLRLEQQRQALEASLQQLRLSLRHWQTWEAEYEGLKEEIQAPEHDPTSDQLVVIAETYDGDLVNEKEVRDLTGLNQGSPRSAKQIIGLIERRQEYVQKNIETVQRQFFEAEAKQEELAFAAANQGGSSGAAGLPLTEIHEELDEEGNVISSQLSQPEEATAKVVESLRKAGLSDEDLKKMPEAVERQLKPAIINSTPPISPSASAVTFEKRPQSDPAIPNARGGSPHGDQERPSIRKKSVSFTADTKIAAVRPTLESQDGKKCVSFAEKVAVMPAAPPPDSRSVSFAQTVEEIPPQPLESNLPSAQPMNDEDIAKAKELTMVAPEAVNSDSEDGPAEEPILPEDESPEDARLRREMLEYHLNEVGDVVAQIELDEAAMDIDEDDDDNSYHTTSEYPEDDDTPYTTGLSESEDSEDEHGRSKGRQISPEYRKQMKELQDRLIGNLGPEPADDEIQDADHDLNPSDVRKLVIRDKRSSTSSVSSDTSEKKSSIKKRVSFAEELDVEPGSPPTKAQKLSEDENIMPVAESILERTTASSHTSSANEKVSRFKRSRAAPTLHQEDKSATLPGSERPEATISDRLMERATSTRPVSAPSNDNPDEAMQRRELAAEYYRRRNDMIRQQGGFKSSADEDEGQGELMEERDGKVKKVSRFKAARITG